MITCHQQIPNSFFGKVMEIRLHYGSGFMSVEIPEANVSEIIRPWEDQADAGNAALVRGALDCGEAGDFSREIEGRTLVVLVGDGSRDMPLADIFGGLFGRLTVCKKVIFLMCTGTHDVETPENRAICDTIKSAAQEAQLTNIEIHIHDCQDDDLVGAGTTSHGTEVRYNGALDRADIFLVLSDVKFHYFAGYSNPIKNFVPGLCSYRTAEQNHSFALDERSTYGIHPWQGDTARRDNPLAADQLEAMELIVKARKVYAMVTISTSGGIQWARFGEAEEVSRRAFAASDERNTHTVTPADRLIVSPGGLPNDVDLYISQRALELTKQGVREGGEVLFVSACPRGIGHERTMENFYNRLTRPIDEIFASIKGEYKLFSHKPYKFARMIRRLRRIWVYSEIADELIAGAHLCPTHEPQAVVDGWIAEDPDTRIIVVDGANKIALYASQTL